MSNAMSVDIAIGLLTPPADALSAEFKGVVLCNSFVDVEELVVLFSPGDTTDVLIRCCSFCAAKLRKTLLMEDTYNTIKMEVKLVAMVNFNNLNMVLEMNKAFKH